MGGGARLVWAGIRTPHRACLLPKMLQYALYKKATVPSEQHPASCLSLRPACPSGELGKRATGYESPGCALRRKGAGHQAPS